MGRIRTVKPELLTHEELFALERETGFPMRIAFIGLFTICDREGRFKWEPNRIKLAVLPYDELDFSRVLDALFTRGFIAKYSIDDRLYGLIPTFLKHQVINNRESGSELPEPDESSYISSTCTRDARVDDATITPLVHAPVEGKGREWKGIGKEGEGDSDASPTPSVSKKNSPKFSAMKYLEGHGVPGKVIGDWLELRKLKKLASTETALDGAIREIKKSGMTVPAAIEYCCVVGWGGFKASWLESENNRKAAAAGKGQVDMQAANRAVVQEMMRKERENES